MVFDGKSSPADRRDATPSGAAGGGGVLPLRFRMLDLSRQLPGPFCSSLLADLGMDVLQITRPGDPMGLGIPALTRNKRSMTLNLRTGAGREILYRLVKDADVLLEGARPGVARRLGIDYETLRGINPRLVYCSLSGYGQDGPYRDRVGHDVNYLGFAGVLGLIAGSDGRPVVPTVQIADIGAGALPAAVGILAALLARASTGEGQLVDVAMLDGAFAWTVYPMLLWQLSGKLPAPGGERLNGGSPGYNVYETKDGRHVTVGAYEPHFWATLCRKLGREDFVGEQWAEGEKRDEMLRVIRAAFRERTLAEWMELFGDEEICFGPVNTLEEACRDPQLRHRGMVVEMKTPRGPMTASGIPIRLSGTPGAIRTPPPALGEHTDAVLASLGYSAAEIARLREANVV